jgi:anti-sigma factor RsiW
VPRPTKVKRRIRSKQGKEVCQQVTDLLLQYVTGELHPVTTSDFEQHLGICPDCVAFLNTYKKTIELTRSFLQRRVEKPPPLRRV